MEKTCFWDEVDIFVFGKSQRAFIPSCGASRSYTLGELAKGMLCPNCKKVIQGNFSVGETPMCC